MSKLRLALLGGSCVDLGERPVTFSRKVPVFLAHSTLFPLGQFRAAQLRRSRRAEREARARHLSLRISEAAG